MTLTLARRSSVSMAGFTGWYGPQRGVTAPVGAVVVNPGSSIATAITTAGAGGTVFLAAGTHAVGASFTPLAGQTILGEYGAILAGGGTTQYVVGTVNNGVTFKNLVVSGFNPPHAAAALHGYGPGTSWIVDHCEFTNNSKCGVQATYGWEVRWCNIHHNGQTGIQSGQDGTNGTFGTGIHVHHNWVHDNNPGNLEDYLWDAGGSKFVQSDGIVIEDNVFSRNVGSGIWLDINNQNATIRRNLCQDNMSHGIWYEISHGSTLIYDNLIQRSGLGELRTVDEPAGIYISNSWGVEVYGNVIEDTPDGIIGINVERPESSTGDPHHLDQLNVHDNIVRRVSRYATGVVGAWTPLDLLDVDWQDNVYESVPTNAWLWGTALTFTDWQSYGRDGGTLLVQDALTFVDVSNGAPPRPWKVSGVDASSVVVEGERLKLTSGATEYNYNAAEAMYSATVTGGSITRSVRLSFENPKTPQYINLALLMDAWWGTGDYPANGYVVSFRPAAGTAGQLVIGKAVGGGLTLQTPVEVTATAGVDVYLEASVVNGAVTARLWPVGGSRPSTPTATWTDTGTVITTGRWGLAHASDGAAKRVWADDFTLGAWAPPSLSTPVATPRAWYDPHLNVDIMDVDDQMGGSPAFLGPDATLYDFYDPRIVKFEGDPFVYMPQVVAAYINRPAVAGLNVTGDIDMRLDKQPDGAWTGVYTRLGGRNGFGQKSYWWDLDETGKIVLNWYDGTADKSATSTVGVSFPSGSRRWVRATLDVDNGAGGHTARFYTSTDGTTWTQLGADVVGTGTTAIVGSDAVLEVGSIFYGGQTAAPAKYFKFRLLSGIDGSLVSEFDPAQALHGGVDGFSEVGPYSAGGAWQYAVNHNTNGSVYKRAIVLDRSLLLFDGVNDFLTVPAAAVPPMTASANWSVTTVVRIHSDANAGSALVDTTTSNRGLRVLETGTAATLTATLSDGTNTVTTPAVAYTRGRNLVVTVSCRDNGATLALNVNGVEQTVSAAAVTGTRTGGSTCRLGGRKDDTGWLSHEWRGLITADRAFTSTEIAALGTYYNAGN